MAAANSAGHYHTPPAPPLGTRAGHTRMRGLSGRARGRRRQKRGGRGFVAAGAEVAGGGRVEQRLWNGEGAVAERRYNGER